MHQENTEEFEAKKIIEEKKLKIRKQKSGIYIVVINGERISSKDLNVLYRKIIRKNKKQKEIKLNKKNETMSEMQEYYFNLTGKKSAMPDKVVIKHTVSNVKKEELISIIKKEIKKGYVELCDSEKEDFKKSLGTKAQIKKCYKIGNIIVGNTEAKMYLRYYK